MGVALSFAHGLALGAIPVTTGRLRVAGTGQPLTTSHLHR